MTTRYDLPNSNYRRQVGIIHADTIPTGRPDKGTGVKFDRRAIPPDARESLWTAADGHKIRRIDWDGPRAEASAAPPRGSLLFFPGRGDHYEKYLEILQHWSDLGWRVTAADWRGQAGSGRFGADARTGHIEDFALWLDDLAEFWAEWSAQHPGPYVLAGHSMGGHLALRGVAEQRVAPDALVLVAPMLGFVGRMPGAIIQPLARAMAALGDPRRPAWKGSEKPGEKYPWRNALLTHDDARYEDELWWREHRPEVAMGPGSWRWVERAYASMRTLEAPGVLEAVTIPVIILATPHDRLVGWRAIARAARRMTRAQLVRFGSEARHEILREADSVRTKALRLIDAFLDQVVPGLQ